MIVTSKNLFLLLGFLVTNLFLAFSFNTSFELVAVAFYLVYLLLAQYLTKIKITADRTASIILVLLLVGITFSSYFTHSLPLTLESVLLVLATVCTFLFFSNIKEQKKELVQLFLFAILVLGLVLTLFFISFLIFPVVGNYLPPLNLLSVEYGHSHLAAVLLIVIPVSLWFVNSKFSKDFSRPVFLPILFSFVLLLTLGRLALALIALFYTFYFFKNRNDQLKKILYVFITITIGFISILSFSDYFCTLGKHKTQFCKPLIEDNRLFYYKQAASGFADNAFFGYGPGTYQLIVDRYHYVPTKTSIYAHNFLLQSLAEYGLPFSLVVGVVTIFFAVKSFQLIRRKKSKDVQFFIAWAYLLIFLNSFFDLDWNIFFTLNLSVILMAFLYPSSRKKPVFLNVLFNVLIFVIGLMGILLILVKLIISDGYPNLAIRVFPYFYQTSNQLINSADLSTESKVVLKDLYWNHPKELTKIASTLPVFEQLEIYLQLETISPWIFTSEEYLKLLSTQGRFEKMGEVAYKGLEILESIPEDAYKPTHAFLDRRVEYLKFAADYHLKNFELATAAKYYKKVFEYRKWALHISKPRFLENPEYSKKAVQELMELIGKNEEHFGQYKNTYLEWIQEPE